MFAAYLYRPIYLLVVIIFTIIVTNRYQPQSYLDGRLRSETNLKDYIFPLLMALFIGFRPVSGIYFVDMWNYNTGYYIFEYGSEFHFNPAASNLIFDNLYSWLGSQYYDIRVLFVLMALIYFLFSYQGISKLFGPYALIGFVAFLGAYSTFSYGTNGIKAGAAAALFLCALGYWRKPLVAAVFLLLSLGFHHSMIMPIAAFVVSWFVKNSKLYFAIWIIAFIVAAAHITYFQELFAGMADERGASYLENTSGTWSDKAGFRLDFILYSALPIFVGYVVLFRYNLKSRTYSFLLNTYLLTNAVWMLCMYASFTNRIAYLSWLMYPVVLIYPFFCKEFMPEQPTRLKQVMWFQLIFTIFMNVVY